MYTIFTVWVALTVGPALGIALHAEVEKILKKFR